MRQYVINVQNLMLHARKKRRVYVQSLETNFTNMVDTIFRLTDLSASHFFGLMKSFGKMLTNFESQALYPQQEELIMGFSLLALIKDKAIMALFEGESPLPLQQGKSCIPSMSFIGCSILSILYVERGPK